MRIMLTAMGQAEPLHVHGMIRQLFPQIEYAQRAGTLAAERRPHRTLSESDQ
jgi:hypothetical protein